MAQPRSTRDGTAPSRDSICAKHQRHQGGIGTYLAKRPAVKMMPCVHRWLCREAGPCWLGYQPKIIDKLGRAVQAKGLSQTVRRRKVMLSPAATFQPVGKWHADSRTRPAMV